MPHCAPALTALAQEYYNRDVSHILNSVVEELSADPEKRCMPAPGSHAALAVTHRFRRARAPHTSFVWSEISFFMKWYENSPPERKAAFRRLVEAGQIEFVGSGWVQVGVLAGRGARPRARTLTR